MQSTSLHAGIIMDGNGRWAERQGLPRSAGHRAGAEAVRRIVRAAPGLGIGTLTLYAFSSDNWHRPETEVKTLLGLLAGYLRDEVENCRANGVRLTLLGRRDRLPLSLRAAVAATERATREGRVLWLRLAIDYSARDQILRAAAKLAGGPADRARFAAALGAAGHQHGPAPDVDLLIRTGGEHRLSDFLLWESAYAELIFRDVAWPEFTPEHLAEAVAEFRGRDRRFGRIASGDSA